MQIRGRGIQCANLMLRGCHVWRGMPRRLWANHAPTPATTLLHPIRTQISCDQSSFDHRVGARDEAWWDRDTEGLCRLEIYDQGKRGWLFYREISRLRAAQYLGELAGQ